MSAPPAPMHYRESYTSRLRSELRRMSVAEPRNPRSQSSSPLRTRWSSAHTSRSGTPERHLCFNTPPTAGSLSDSSSIRDAQECLKSVSNNPSNRLIDTRSKTLSKATYNNEDRSQNMKKNNNNIDQEEGKEKGGYGKPLVTPVSRGLVIKKEMQPSPTQQSAEKRKVTLRARGLRSPIKSWRAENSQSFPSNPIPSGAVLKNNSKSNSKILYPFMTSVLLHLIIWRAAHIASYFIHQWLVTFTAAVVLFWTATKRIVSGYHGDKPGTAVSSDVERGNVKTPAVPRVPVNGTLKRPPTLRETLTKQICVECNPVFGTSKMSSRPHSNRNFKPQLEDIKSSFLLLNNGKNESTISNGGKLKSEVTKPKPLNENQRKEMLMETKKKFQTKDFKNNARYEKIEGLNWISWKY